MVVVRERGLSSGRVGLASGVVIWGLEAGVSLRWGLGGLRHFRGAHRPFRHSSRGLPRVRQSGAIRVLVALVRMILALWAAPPRCGYWGSLGFFGSAPQDFGMLGVFCARFPPREASILIRFNRLIFAYR